MSRFILPLLLFPALSLPAQAIWHVTPSGAGTNSGADWQNASGDLQAVIDAAEPGDEIWVAAGVYVPSVPHGGSWSNHRTFYVSKNIGIYGGFAGNETIRSQRDWLANPTVLSGDLDGDDEPDIDAEALLDHTSRTDNAYHVVRIGQVGATMVLSGFSIENGNARFTDESARGGGLDISGSGSGHAANPRIEHCTFYRNSAYDNGGAIFNDGANGGAANMQLDGCTFQHNYAYLNGGAVFNAAEAGGEASPSFARCTFVDNTSGFDGAAVFNNGITGGISSPVFDSCVFENNSAGRSGGGVYNFAHAGMSSPMFSACRFTGNSAMRGGAIHNAGVENGQSNPRLSSCLFENNAAESYGGAVYNNGDNGNANAVFDDCVFAGNSSEFQGGAVYNNGEDGASSPGFRRCRFENNTSEGDGGALLNHGNSAPLIDSCLFSGNSAQGGGGAMCNRSTTGETTSPVTVRCYFSGNSALVGGAIWDNAVFGACFPLIVECTFSQNAAAEGGAVRSLGGPGANYDPKWINCLFTGNTASANGGALNHNWSSPNFPSVVNCVFLNNTAAEGGAIYGFSSPLSHPRFTNLTFSGNSAGVGGAMNIRSCNLCFTPDLLVRNCIFRGNQAATGQSMYIHEADPQVDYCLLEESFCQPGALCGSHVIYQQDPLFADPAGGDLRLLAGSPAINTGLNAAMPDTIKYDLGGNLRIMGSAIDMGAFEFGEAVGTDNPDVALLSFDAGPNPFRDRVTITFEIPAAMQVQLRITDVAGKILFYRSEYHPAGRHIEVFQTGEQAPKGVLFCEMVTPSGRAVKVVVRV